MGLSDYGLVVVEEDEYDEAVQWALEDPLTSSIEKINTQIEEMKTIMTESKRRSDVQGKIIQEMRRRLSEAELMAEQQQQKIATLESVMSDPAMTEQITTPGRATEQTATDEEELSASEQTNEQGQGSDFENLNKLDLESKVLKLEARSRLQDDVNAKRSLLVSNLGLDNVDLIRDNHYPKIRYFLRQLDLGFVFDMKHTHVRLYKSGAIKIRYNEEWMARWTLNRITYYIKRVKEDRQFFGERIYRMAKNIKFSICTPPRFSRERRLLAAEGMRLKSTGKVKYFDFIIIHGRLLMKTFQRLDGYQFYEAFPDQNQVIKTAISSLNHKMGRHYYNMLHDKIGMPANLLRTPHPTMINMNGGPLMIHDDRTRMEARLRHEGMWYPTPGDRGMEPDNDRGVSDTDSESDMALNSAEE